MPPRVPRSLGVFLGWLLLSCTSLVFATDAPPPACDLFGDPLPSGAVARLGTVRLRHVDYLRRIAFSPDGKAVVSMGDDGVRVWDAATGRPLRHFAEGVLPRSIALSLDGQRVAFGRYHSGIGGPVDVWDVTTGKLLHKLGRRHYAVVCFSPDGKRLAALEGENAPGRVDTAWNIDVWSAETGRLVSQLTGPNEHASDMIFSADGENLLLGGSDKAVSIRNISNGKEVRRFRDLPGNVRTLFLSPSGDRLAFAELWFHEGNGLVRWGNGTRWFLLDLDTSNELRRFGPQAETDSAGDLKNGRLWGLAFSPDGRKLATCDQNGPIRIWDTAKGSETQVIPIGRKHSGGIAFSPDGRTLALGAGGRAIRLIDLASAKDQFKDDGHQSSVTALAVTADGCTVFTAGEDGTISRWDARTGRELGRLTGHLKQVNGLALSPDGNLLCSVSNDGTLRVWDVQSGKDRRLLEKSSLSWEHFTLSPDGKMLAVPLNSNDLLVFNPTTGRRLHRWTPQWQILAIAFNADASILTALIGDHTICRWQTASGRRLPDFSLPLDRDEPPRTDPDSSYSGTKIILSADDRLMAHATDDRFLHVLDVDTQREVFRRAKLSGKVSALAFAHDSRTLAWAEQSGVIHWLELASGSERRTLPGHAGGVTHMIFSTGGRQLISGSHDCTALVWDLLGSETTLSLAVCWDALADKDAAKAYRAICRLMAVPTDTLALLSPRLKAVTGVDERNIKRLVADLDADAFAVREKAAEELRKLDGPAEPAIRKALGSRPTLESRRRLRALLDDIVQHQWRPSADTLRLVRAIEVLERIGTSEARALLESLARGTPGARMTREAQAALRRPNRRAEKP